MAKDKKSSSGGASGTEGRQKQSPVQNRVPDTRFATVNPVEFGEFLGKLYASQDMDFQEEMVLEWYKSDGFMNMNRLLRNPEDRDLHFPYDIPNTEENINKAIQRANRSSAMLTKAPTQELGQDTMLYRSMEFWPNKANALQDMISDGIANGTLIGSSYTDKGFGSTTINKERVDNREIQLHIRAPKETRVFIPDPNTNNYGGEYEVLLNTNTRYTIQGYTQTANGLILEVDIN